MKLEKPIMGWNTWNTFGEKINEELIMQTADKMVELGYKDAGYEYVIIDDCWSMKKRDENNRLVADPEKFPHGMKYLADYIHKKGLKFGMYSDCGYWTCARYPGSFGYEYIDAKTFAEWGVDYLKYDYGYFPESADTKNAYLGDAVISIGKVDSAFVSKKDIFKKAFDKNASKLVVLHNHPSGNPTPSSSDIQMTKRLIECAEILDLWLMDHIIIGDNIYYSFLEHQII